MRITELDLKKYLSDYAYLFGLAGLIVALDQWTKWIVRNNLALGERWVPWTWLEPYARIVHWENTGAAFGMFQGMSTVFAVLAFVVALVIIYYYPQVPREDWPLRLAMGMQLGGAVGNLIDRLTQSGTVTDFISVGSFAVFNIADASISVGVAVLIIGMWWKERQEQRSAAREEQESGSDSPTSPLQEEFERE